MLTLAIVGGSAAGTLILTPGEPLRVLGPSHLTLAAAAVALGMLGAASGVVLRDPLDAALAGLTIALASGFAVLVAGPPAGDLPTPLLNLALLASPVVAVASAAGVDILRGELLYRLSPIAHRRFDYPDWQMAVAFYGALACVLFTVALVRRRARSV